MAHLNLLLSHKRPEMNKYLIPFCLTAILFFACNNNQPAGYSFRDSAMTEYLKRADSLGLEDSTAMLYKLLTAYRNNDKPLLNEMLNHQYYVARHFSKLFGKLPQLQKMDIDEGYSFFHSQSFCAYAINVTITKKDTNVLLHVVISKDTANSGVVKQFGKRLSLKNWEKFTDIMGKTDFWGLKTDNGIHGLDGDMLIVVGYSRRSLYFDQAPKFNAVSRWGGSNLGLLDVYYFLLSSTGEKPGVPCY